MPRRHTTATAIRKYKSEYLRLYAYEARLNHELYNMKRRINLLAEDEQNSLAKQVLLTDLLKQATQQKTELEQQSASKARNKQLKKAEKEYKEVKAQWSRNEHHLAVIDKKKDKDNVAKLVLKEAKRDEVTARANAAKATWIKLEQMQQYVETGVSILKTSTHTYANLDSQEQNIKDLPSATSTSPFTFENIQLVRLYYILATVRQMYEISSIYKSSLKIS